MIILQEKTETDMRKEKTGFTHGTSDWKDVKGKSIHTDGCILLFCVEGEAEVSVEFKSRSIRKKDFTLIFPDTVFIVNEVSENFTIKYIETSSELFDESTLWLSATFFDVIYDNPIFHTTSEQWALIRAWGKQFSWITRCPSPRAEYMMLRNHVQNFFLALESIVIAKHTGKRIPPASSTRQLFNRFYRLLVKNCYSQRDVKFYAEKLCITPYYLSKITRKTANLSPKEIIDRQVVTEMKRMLTSTDLSIKELAAHFHFDTVSYLARFFRRHTNFTPNEFRNRQ